MLSIKNEREMMIAPCGINCTYCYAHHKKEKQCQGCRQTDNGKPEHCKKCKIRICSDERRILFCCDCTEYPCVLIKRLDKSYQTRYNESILNNMMILNARGIDYYLSVEKERLKCPECNGILNIHDKKCSECGKIFEVNRLDPRENRKK